jgi:hypothetical protein
MPLRIASLIALLLVIGVYHATGLHFVYWPDSGAYIEQALSLIGPGPYVRPVDRGIGYPLLLTVALAFPASALALIAIQAGLVVLVYVLLYTHLRSAAAALTPRHDHLRSTFQAMLPLGLVLTAAYSALHVFILSALPEILFATLAGLAIIAVGRFVAREDGSPGALVRAAVTSAIATLPILVKPHWMIAAPLLAAVVAITMVSTVRRGHALRLALAIAVPFAAWGTVSWPERHLSATVNPEAALFGPRTLFCNHMHMIQDALVRNPALKLHADPAIDVSVRQSMADIRARDTKPWRHLGFNGDLCMFDNGLRRQMQQVLPGVEAQRRFLMDAYATAVAAEPLRFARLFLTQMVAGLTVSFQKFSHHATFEASAWRDNVASLGYQPSFLYGTTTTGEAGPLGSKARMKQTVAGRAVEAALAGVFTALLVAYLGLVALTVVAGPLRFSRWSAPRRRAFLAYVAVPLVAVLGHHALVAITHSFDIWRYAFNVYFVTIGFIGAASLFWFCEFVPEAELQQSSDA